MSDMSDAIMTTKNLLVELFVEELPPKALNQLGEAFAGVLFEQLQAQGLTTPESILTTFASPRRLAAHVTRVASQAADRLVSQKLMPVAVGLDAAGNATPALLKKLATLGADVSLVAGLKKVQDAKAQTLVYDSIVAGATLAEGLQKALLDAIAKLPIPKVMTYQLQSNCELPGWSSVRFVRPAHALVALHGAAVVPVQALGLTAGNATHGHRFEAAVDPVVLRHADSYTQQLRDDGAVVASFAERRAEITRQLAAAAAQIGGGITPIDDDALLNEVTALVERPNVLLCAFDKEFLDVPQECLILTMKANQKYFALLDAVGKLTHQFLVVSNITPDDPSLIVGGNERVVRPRLADAKFFFDQDRKKTLASRVAGLDKVVYHHRLGSQGARITRVRAIARWVAQRIGADSDLADRAALLAKADLGTEMVGEFPELQGVMGSYYARHDGETEEVARAIAEQYLLKGQHELGASLVSTSLILADRIETLIGIWGVGLKPTGEKDPFALRRHALTVISHFELLNVSRGAGDRAVTLDVKELLAFAAGTFDAGLIAPDTVDAVTVFIYERYWNQLAPLYGVSAVKAVITQYPPLHQVVKRVDAVVEFKKLAQAPCLAAANKRISNILRKSGAVEAHVRETLLKEDAEIALHAAMKNSIPHANTQFDAGHYAASLQLLAALREPVDAFFNGVMVNVEEVDVRVNRLGLLKSLHNAMNRVADLSQLAD